MDEVHKVNKCPMRQKLSFRTVRVFPEFPCRPQIDPHHGEVSLAWLLLHLWIVVTYANLVYANLNKIFRKTFKKHFLLHSWRSSDCTLVQNQRLDYSNAQTGHIDAFWPAARDKFSLQASISFPAPDVLIDACINTVVHFDNLRFLDGKCKAYRTLWCLPPPRTSERDARYCTRACRNKIMAFTVYPAYCYKFRFSMVSVAIRYVLSAVSYFCSWQFLRMKQSSNALDDTDVIPTQIFHRWGRLIARKIRVRAHDTPNKRSR